MWEMTVRWAVATPKDCHPKSTLLPYKVILGLAPGPSVRQTLVGLTLHKQGLGF